MMSETRLVDEATVRAVCDYLHQSFGEKRVVPFVEQGIQGFRIEDIYGTLLHVLAVSSDFFDAHPSREIPSVLLRYQVAAALRQAGRTPVEVTTSGIRAASAKAGGAERIAG